MARPTGPRSWATSRLFAAGEEQEERAVGDCAGDGAELGWGCVAGNLGCQWALASSAELSAFRCPEGTALPSMQTGSFLDSTNKTEDVEPQLGVGSESKNGVMPKDRFWTDSQDCVVKRDPVSFKVSAWNIWVLCGSPDLATNLDPRVSQALPCNKCYNWSSVLSCSTYFRELHLDFVPRG